MKKGNYQYVTWDTLDVHKDYTVILKKAGRRTVMFKYTPDIKRTMIIGMKTKSYTREI